MIGIYTIVSPSGKIYIGQSWDIEKRWCAYKRFDCNDQPAIYGSLLKYGPENHRFTIIETFDSVVSQHILDFWETIWILRFKVSGFGVLNLKEGGSHGKHSEESKKKMSLAQRGRKISEETKEKLRKNNLGKKQSAEAKAKQILAQIGNRVGFKHSEESKKKMSDSLKGRVSPNKGKKLSKEHVEKLAARKRGVPQSEEHKRKIREALTGKTTSLKGKPWSEARRAAQKTRLQ